MAVFTFSGDPRSPGTDPDSINMHDIDFPLNEAVEVEDAEVAAKLRRHNHFTEIKNGDGAPKPRGKAKAGK